MGDACVKKHKKTLARLVKTMKNLRFFGGLDWFDFFKDIV